MCSNSVKFKLGPGSQNVCWVEESLTTSNWNFILQLHLSRRGSTLGREGGHLPPTFTCCPSPESKASWPVWRDFWGPKMLQNQNFPGVRAGGAYSAPPGLLTDGYEGRCRLPRTLPPLSALRVSFLYGSQDLTQYRVGNPTNDRFQM